MKITDLKALFWKEWHENLRWALLALLALALGLAYAEYRQPSFQSLSQIWSDTDLVLTIAVPLIGLALGLLQILPELRRDQWAFLVHRPVTRTTLFFGKVIPGVCLYLLATISPLLGFALWASSPRHVPAPFDVRFTLAGWAAILTGLSFYFAGLLVALRPARWYGSRALPVLTALIAPWAAVWFTEFWQAALVCVLTAVILMLAAWGSLVTAGDYKEQTKSARFALGLALYPAVLAVGVGAVLLSFSTYQFVEDRSGTEWWRTDYKIDAQGRIFEVSEHGPNAANMNSETLTVTDLAGHVVDPRVWEKISQKNTLLEMSYLPVSPEAQRYVMSYQKPERYVSFLDGERDSEQFVRLYYSSRSRQIEQYDIPASGAPAISYLGPNGFSRDKTQAGQFPPGMPFGNSFAGLLLLQFSHSLFWYDLAPPRAVLLQDAPGPIGVLGTAFSPDERLYYSGDQRAENSSKPEAYFVAADNQVTVYARPNSEAKPAGTRRLFSTPLLYGGTPGEWTNVQVAAAPDLARFFFWYQDESSSGADHVVTVGANGGVLQTETFPASGRQRAAASKEPAPLTSYAAFLAFPPAVAPLTAVYASLGSALGWSSAKSFQNSPIEYWRVFLTSCLTGLVAFVLAWRISRRCGDSRRGQIAWAFGVFWLGGYGVLLLLALRAWPARVPCPNCGRLRVVDRATCEHCGALFARPVRDGTEIFEEAEEAAVR